MFPQPCRAVLSKNLRRMMRTVHEIERVLSDSQLQSQHFQFTYYWILFLHQTTGKKSLFLQMYKKLGSARQRKKINKIDRIKFALKSGCLDFHVMLCFVTSIFKWWRRNWLLCFTWVGDDSPEVSLLVPTGCWGRPGRKNLMVQNMCRECSLKQRTYEWSDHVQAVWIGGLRANLRFIKFYSFLVASSIILSKKAQLLQCFRCKTSHCKYTTFY